MQVGRPSSKALNFHLRYFLRYRQGDVALVLVAERESVAPAP